MPLFHPKDVLGHAGSFVPPPGHGEADINVVCVVKAVTVVGQVVEDMYHGDFFVVGVGVLELDDSGLLHNTEDESACFSVSDGNKNGPGLLGFEYNLPFAHVLVVWIGGHLGVVVVGVDVFEAVEGMAKTGGVFGLWIDDTGEYVVITMVVKALEDFDNGASDAFDVGIGRRSYHRFEDVVGGKEGVRYLAQGRHYGSGARSWAAAARSAASDTREIGDGLGRRQIKSGTAAARAAASGWRHRGRQRRTRPQRGWPWGRQ